MSLNMYVEPVAPVRNNDLGGGPLKQILCRAFAETDGTVRQSFTITRHEKRILEALRRVYHDSPDIRSGISTILAHLEQHNAVRLWTD